MNDDVFSVDQHPIAGWEAFHFRIGKSRFFELTHNLVRDRSHVALRPARGDDHRVCDFRLAGEVDGDDLFRLVVVQLFENDVEDFSGSGFRIKRSEALRLLLSLRCVRSVFFKKRCFRDDF